MVEIPESGTPWHHRAIRLDPWASDVDKLFKNASIGPILKTLCANPGRWFKLTELFDEAGVKSRASSQQSIELLVRADWVEDRREGNARLIRIQNDILVDTDPYRRIPRPYRDVLRWFMQQMDDELGGRGAISHVVVFGSVVGDTADRLSDIDLLIVARNDREVRQAGRRITHELATEGHEGDRYEIDLHVESPRSLPQRTADPRFPEMIRRGVRLRDDPETPIEDLLPESSERAESGDVGGNREGGD